MKLLLFAGAGTSIELGVPGMLGLGEQFLEHSRQWTIEPDLVQRLMQSSMDVEHLIEALDRVSSARPALDAIGGHISALDQVEVVRAEVEWFVQHSAERVVTSDARLMWGPILRASSSVDLSLVTTNYDRSIELAANAENVELDDGFGAFGGGELASWLGFEQKEGIPLVKLHGSTDWYEAGASANPVKLRHPMPLFGHATLRLPGGRELGSALVLPSREKLLTHDPYPRLSQWFLNAADCCDVAVFIGSSLRDPHIRGAAQTIARRVPLFIVNPAGDTYGVEGALAIAQFASTFLIATLPNALLETQPVSALNSVVGGRKGDKGILQLVQQALDFDARPELRCEALEQLDEMEATLESELLRRLLLDDDSQVARYCLGLISLSSDRDSLIEAAVDCPHVNDRAFAEDLRLLRDMVSTSDEVRLAPVLDSAPLLRAAPLGSG